MTMLRVMITVMIDARREAQNASPSKDLPDIVAVAMFMSEIRLADTAKYSVRISMCRIISFSVS